MKIIPVIDLKQNLVVSAQQGQRDSYQPIKSTLCNSSSIHAVIEGFLSLYPFDTLYIADLDAITNKGNHTDLINAVVADYSEIEFWVDRGQKIQNITGIYPMNYKLIIGSESQEKIDFKAFEAILKKNILSLDFFPNQGYVGSLELLNNATLWPQNIIIMSLHCVGKNTGADVKRLNFFCQKYPDKNFIAAGGIRDIKDLYQLKKLGVNHALIASALHSGAINQQIMVTMMR